LGCHALGNGTKIRQRFAIARTVDGRGAHRHPGAASGCHHRLGSLQKAVGELGQVQTQQIEADIVERLRKPFGDLVGKWPPE
jgi:hypothetical protein